MTLRGYLTVLTLATLMPVVLFAIVLSVLLLDRDRETFRRGAEERTLALLTAVDTELNGSISTVQALAVMVSLRDGDLGYFRKVAAAALRTQPYWTNINLARPSGQQIMNLAVPEGQPLPNIGQMDGSFERLLETRAPVVSDLAMGPVLKRWSFAVRAPVLGANGEVKYVLSAGVNPDALARIVNAQELPPGWVGVVLDRNDRIVARSFDPQAKFAKLASPSLREGLARTQSGWFRGTTLERDDVYTSYRRSAITGWAFAMAIPADAVDAAAARTFWALGLGVLGALVLAIVAAYLISRRIALPIGALASATDAMARGVPIEDPGTPRIAELRKLADAVRAGAQAIHERQAHIERDQTALRASEERLRLALEASPSANVMIDGAGRIVLVNRQTERLFGYARGELIGQPMELLVPARFRARHPEYRAAFAATPQARPMGAGRELYGLRKDGSEVPIEIGLGPIEIEGEPFVLSAIVDITERKRAEEALRQADRAKDEFLATLSHELRNPLAALTSSAHVLKVVEPGSAAAIETRAVVERQTMLLTRLVDDLLDLSSIAVGKISLRREKFDLGDLAAKVFGTWRETGRRAGLEIALDAEHVWVEADRVRMEQVLANLLDNAVKFTPPGKCVRLSARAEGAHAVLEVSDEGQGIDARELAHVFELFVQGEAAPRRRKGGMGIGLALVKRLVEMQGGTVSAASEGIGRGATFAVRLPVAVKPAVASERGRARPGRGAQRVLIVDDNDDARATLQRVLELSGHEVCAVRDATSAIAAAERHQPDVALIDIALPDVDGYEVARRLRQRDADHRLRLVAITGYGQENDRRRALEAGFDVHLTKPVSLDRLKQIIAGAP